MPALVPASIAMVSILPGPAALALVGLQVIGTSNPVIDLYDTKHDWRLPEIPWRAALRIEPEEHYLQRNIGDFANDSMVANSTPGNARTYSLAAIHQAYLPAEVLVYWQSELADRFLDYLKFAHESWDIPAELLSWRWPTGSYQSLRVSALSDLRIIEAQLRADLDSTGSVAWKSLGTGDRLDLPAPPGGTGADLLIWPGFQDLAAIQAQTSSGKWQPIDRAALTSSHHLDVRRTVMAYIRRAGYRYILVSTENGQFAAIGRDMLDHSASTGSSRRRRQPGTSGFFTSLAAVNRCIFRHLCYSQFEKFPNFPLTMIEA